MTVKRKLDAKKLVNLAIDDYAKHFKYISSVLNIDIDILLSDLNNIVENNSKIVNNIQRLLNTNHITSSNYIKNILTYELCSSSKYRYINYNLSNDIYDLDSTKIRVIDRLFNKYFDLIKYIDSNNLYKYLDFSKHFIENMKDCGISTSLLIQHHRNYKHSVCSPKELINFLNIESELFFLQFKTIVYSDLDMSADQYLWTIINEKWMRSYSIFNYKNVQIKIHNHTIFNNVLNRLKNQQFNSYKDIKNNRAKLLLKSPDYQNKLNELIEYTYQHRYNEIPFNIPQQFQNTNIATVLKCAKDLTYEGTKMKHCVGGADYIEKCQTGNTVIVHFNGSKEFTAEFEYYKFMPQSKYDIVQAKYESNGNISSEDLSLALDYILSVNFNMKMQLQETSS